MKKFIWLSLFTTASLELYAIGGTGGSAATGQGFNNSGNGGYYTQTPPASNYNQSGQYYNNPGSQGSYNNPGSYNQSSQDGSNYNPSSGYNNGQGYYYNDQSSQDGSSYYNQNPYVPSQSNQPNNFQNSPNYNQGVNNPPQAYNSRGQSNRYIGQSNDTVNSTEKKYPQDFAATDLDRQVNTRIRDKITGWFTDSYKNVSLSTSNGVVTLGGYVNNQDDITKLVNEIRNINGVKSVTNNVQVKQVK